MASAPAKVAKDKGNASFKAGNFADAVGHYSAAIVADRTDPTLPLNRAAAYLKLGKHHDAERDCSTVLNLNSKNVKALFRRAQARTTLEKLPEAENDLLYALQLEPANDSVKKELAIVKRRKLEAANVQPSRKKEPMTVTPLSSQPKSTNEASTLRRVSRKVPIEIVEQDEPPVAAPTSPTDFLKPLTSRVLAPSPAPFESTSPSTSFGPQAKPKVGAALFRADGKYTIIRDPSQPSAAMTNPSSTASVSSPSPARSSSSDTTRPLTHFTFSRAWYALRTSHERYNLLRCVPPESLPSLFQTSLEPTLLVSILDALSGEISPTTLPEIAKYMDTFPMVQRFSTVVLFLTPKEKEVVRGILSALGNSSAKDSWDV